MTLFYMIFRHDFHDLSGGTAREHNRLEPDDHDRGIRQDLFSHIDLRGGVTMFSAFSGGLSMMTQLAIDCEACLEGNIRGTIDPNGPSFTGNSCIERCFFCCIDPGVYFYFSDTKHSGLE
jgi:hypothetical protein